MLSSSRLFLKSKIVSVTVRSSRASWPALTSNVASHFSPEVMKKIAKSDTTITSTALPKLAPLLPTKDDLRWMNDLEELRRGRKMTAVQMLEEELAAQKDCALVQPLHEENANILRRLQLQLQRTHGVKDDTTSCKRCGRPNHEERDCRAHTTIALDCCHKCGRPAHWAQQCKVVQKQHPIPTESMWRFNSGSYVLLSSATGQRYVGTSTDIRKRFAQHTCRVRGGARFCASLKKLRRVMPLPLYRPAVAGYQTRKAVQPGELRLTFRSPEVWRSPRRIATIDPRDPIYCDESRQMLAQMRSFGPDNVRGAAFCKLKHNGLDRFKMALMLRRERKWLERCHFLHPPAKRAKKPKTDEKKSDDEEE